MFSVLISTIFPVFSLIVVGFLLRLKGVINPAYAKTTNHIVVKVAIPEMLISEICQVPFWTNFSLVKCCVCLQPWE